MQIRKAGNDWPPEAQAHQYVDEDGQVVATVWVTERGDVQISTPCALVTHYDRDTQEFVLTLEHW